MKAGVKIALTVIVVGMVLAGHTVAAQGQRGRGGPSWGQRPDVGPPGGPGGPGGPAGRFGPAGGPADAMMLQQALRRLNLTDEQREQVRDVLEANREAARTAQEALADAQKALQEAVKDGADEAAIRAAATAVGKAIGDQAVTRVAGAAGIKEILTVQQREQWEQMKKRGAEMRQKTQDPQFPGPRAGGPGQGLRPGGGPWARGPQGPGRPGPGGTPLRPGPNGPGSPRSGAGPWGRGPEGRGGPGPRVGPRGPMGSGQLFDRKDTNRDGRLTRDELQGDEGDRQRPFGRLFERADANNDGALTAEELEALRARVQPRRGGPPR